MGYHTFSFFQKMNEMDYSSVVIHFNNYANRNNDIKRFPIKDNKGWGFTYKQNKGIRWILSSRKEKNGFLIQGVTVIINPKALFEGNYITAAQEGDLEYIEKKYNEEAAKISPLLFEFGSCSVNRADACLNIDLKELGIPCTPQQIMALIKQGNVPKGFEERKEKYDEKQHRKITDRNSFYLTSKSLVINYYWKFPKQDEKHPNYLFRKASQDVIRFEVQCKYPKLYYYFKNADYKSKYTSDNFSLEKIFERASMDIYFPFLPIDVVLSDRFSEKIVRKYFYKVLRKGDYFTLEGARSIVESYNFRREKQERLIYALELVNECHGIEKAKSKLCGIDLADFKKSLRDLDSILVNPVTIPRRWNIQHIPNLLRAYYDAIFEEELVPEEEYLARKRIEEFLCDAR